MTKRVILIQLLCSLATSIKAVEVTGIVPEEVQIQELDPESHKEDVRLEVFMQCKRAVHEIRAEEGTGEHNQQLANILMKIKAEDIEKLLKPGEDSDVLVDLMDVFRDLAGKFNHLQPADFQANPALELIRDVLELRDIFTDSLGLFVCLNRISVADLIGLRRLNLWKIIAELWAEKQKAQDIINQYTVEIQKHPNNKAIRIAENFVENYRRILRIVERKLNLFTLLHNFYKNVDRRADGMVTKALKIVVCGFILKGISSKALKEMLEALDRIDPDMTFNASKYFAILVTKFLPETIGVRILGDNITILGRSIEYAVLSQEELSVDGLKQVCMLMCMTSCFAFCFGLCVELILSKRIEEIIGFIFNEQNLALE